MSQNKKIPENYTYETAVQAALEHKPEGFDWLYRTTYPNAFHLAMLHMKNENDAMDLLHDSYIKAWENLANLRNPGKFQTWFHTIITNTAKDIFKRKKPVYLEEMLFETEEGFQYPFEAESHNKNCQPEKLLEERIRQIDFLEWLQILPEAQFICVKLYYMDGLKTTEIAEKLGCPVATVRSRLMYARKKLLKTLPPME